MHLGQLETSEDNNKMKTITAVGSADLIPCDGYLCSLYFFLESALST